MTEVKAYTAFLDEVDAYAAETGREDLKSLVAAAREALQLDLAIHRPAEGSGGSSGSRLTLTLLPSEMERQFHLKA